MGQCVPGARVHFYGKPALNISGTPERCRFPVSATTTTTIDVHSGVDGSSPFRNYELLCILIVFVILNSYELISFNQPKCVLTIEPPIICKFDDDDDEMVVRLRFTIQNGRAFSHVFFISTQY